MASELERALQTHSVRGYPVDVPIFGRAVLENSTTVRNGVYYRIRPVEPMFFDKLAWLLHLDAVPRGKEDWVKPGSEGLVSTEEGQPVLRRPQMILPPEIQARLDAGEMVSWKDVIETWVARGGCLDDARRVTCYDVFGEEVTIPLEEVRRGMLVEFFDSKTKKWNWSGRVVKVEGELSDRTVYLELFEPVPFMDTPAAMNEEKIKPGFYSDFTWKLSFGTAAAWAKSNFPLPPGEWVQDENRTNRPSFLPKDPLHLDEVRAMCAKMHPEQPQCVIQSLLMYIIPIQPFPDTHGNLGGRFRPIPDDAARAGVYLVWRAEGPEETR